MLASVFKSCLRSECCKKNRFSSEHQQPVIINNFCYLSMFLLSSADHKSLWIEVLVVTSLHLPFKSEVIVLKLIQWPSWKSSRPAIESTAAVFYAVPKYLHFCLCSNMIVYILHLSGSIVLQQFYILLLSCSIVLKHWGLCDVHRRDWDWEYRVRKAHAWNSPNLICFINRLYMSTLLIWFWHDLILKE
jgi:hypothetical protein